MQAKKAFPWVQRFYDETAFDTAPVTDIVYSRYVVDRVEQVSSVLKNRTFFFIRDETCRQAAARVPRPLCRGERGGDSASAAHEGEHPVLSLQVLRVHKYKC